MSVRTGQVIVGTTPALVYQASDWVQIAISAIKDDIVIGSVISIGFDGGFLIPENTTMQAIVLAPNDIIYAVAEASGSRLSYIVSPLPWLRATLATVSRLPTIGG